MKNKSAYFFVAASFILLLSFLYSCKKESLKVASTVTISEATNVTANSATVGSTITADGGSEVLSEEFAGILVEILQPLTIKQQMGKEWAALQVH